MNHMGLFIVISSGSLGSADYFELKMNLIEGKVTNYAYLDNKAIKLPFEVKLNDFEIDEYKPHLVIVNQARY